ncbi:MAG: hypothetical protein ACM3JJ_06075 [Hyphomicrobiales bacterium]
MNKLDRIVVGTIRATGGFQVLVGLLFWFGWTLALIPVHMLVGALFVLALLLLAARGLRFRTSRGLAALTAGWSVLVLAFGMAQAQILPGSHHWIVRTLHLAFGIAAMGIADALRRRMAVAGATRRVAVPAGLGASPRAE